MGFHSTPGITKLSELEIDVSKDWAAKKIENLGVPDSDNDAVARGLVGDIYSSDFGLKWADLGVVASGHVLSIAYLGNGIAILGDAAGHVYRSTDHGATWSDLGAISLDWIEDIAHLGNGIVVLGDSVRHVFRSTDYGATWTDLGVIAAGYIMGMAYLGNGIAILGDIAKHVFRSTDYGATWPDLGEISSRSVMGMAYLGNGIVVLGDDVKHVFRSIDYGATWTDLGEIATGEIYSMAYLGNGIAVLGDNFNHVYRSTDYGATWSDLGVIASDVILAMAYLGNGIAILGDDANHVYRSTSAFQTSNFNPNQFDKLFQFGCLGAITANGTSYLAPGNGATQTNEIKVTAPRPGILKNLYIWQRVASGAGGRTDIYTVRVNGADKAITCTLDNAIEGSDTTNQVLVAAGDEVSIKLVSNNVADTSADVVATLELT